MSILGHSERLNLYSLSSKGGDKVTYNQEHDLSEPSFVVVMTYDTDFMSHEGHFINANYNMATLPW